MDELEQWAADWHKKRYGVVIDPFKTLTKLAEEVGELGKALLKGDKVNAVEEVADVAIVLMHMARYLGVSLKEAIKIKQPVLNERLSKKN